MVAFKRSEKKVEFIKKIIRKIAKEKNISRNQYYRITNADIWDWIEVHKNSRAFTFLEMKNLRNKLPKSYRTKI